MVGQEPTWNDSTHRCPTNIGPLARCSQAHVLQPEGRHHCQMALHWFQSPSRAACPESLKRAQSRRDQGEEGRKQHTLYGCGSSSRYSCGMSSVHLQDR